VTAAIGLAGWDRDIKMQEPTGPKKVKIDSRKYFIRTLTTDDASDRLAAWFSDPNVNYMLNAPAKIWSKDDVVNYVKGFNQTSKLLLGIFEKGSNVPVGIFTILINQNTNQGLINILIGETDYRNKGIRSSRVLIDIGVPFYDYLFQSLGLTEVLASALARNKILINMLFNHGWKLDQTLKGHQKSNSDGSMLDVCLFSLTRNSWGTSGTRQRLIKLGNLADRRTPAR
jgi:RimJ/RimL family protein N-acetyltransferase